VAGAVTLPVVSGFTYELAATANATVTLTGSLGSQVAIVAAPAYAVTVAGTAVTAGTYVAHKVTAGWVLYPVGAAAVVTPPAAPVLTLTGTTTTATVTWPAASGATGYNVRVNGGTTVAAGNVLTYNATGLPFSTAGTIEVQATNTAGASSWVSAGFTTATPTPVVLRLTPNHATVTESGDATNGWNYAFAATPYQKGAASTLGLPANTDGFLEYTIPGLAAGTAQPIVYFNTTANNTLSSTSDINGVSVQTADLKYGSQQQAASFISTVVAVNGDRVRIGRTGLVYYTQYSRDNEAT
jgi:hypothetical protein